MSTQDTPYSSPPDRTTGSEPGLGQASGLESGKAGGLTDDLKTATDTAKNDLRAAADVASRDFASLKDQVTSEFSNLKSQAGGDLSQLKDQASGQIQNLTSQAKDQLGQVTEQAKSYATEQVSHLTERARSLADQGKGTAAQQLRGVVEAASRIADDLRDNEQAKVVVPYADNVVSGLRQLADTVENRSVDDLVGMVRDFGRRQPAAFLSVAAIAGFAASRFLMASARRASTYDDRPRSTGMDSDFASGGMDASTGLGTSAMGGTTGLSGSEFGTAGSTLGTGGSSSLGTAGSTLGTTGATEFGGSGTLGEGGDDRRDNTTGMGNNGRL